MDASILNELEKRISVKEFLSRLKIDFIETSSYEVRGPCPIHGGDNLSAFVVYARRGSRWGWACYSNNCHLQNGSDMIGLVSSYKKITREEASNFIVNEFCIKTEKIEVINQVKKKSQFEPIEPKVLKEINENTIKKFIFDVNKTDYFKKLNISDKIITKFKLGFNIELNRVVIPVFDDKNRLVGHSMRYVDDNYIDTVDINGNFIQKYKISYGLKKSNVLYGLNLVKDRIKNNSVVLVEGFKDVWALSKFDIPAVSVFGHVLSREQLFLLKNLVNKVIVCFDNDKKEKDKMNPGQQGAKKALSLLKRNGIEAINLCTPENIDLGDAFIKKEMCLWIKNNIEVHNGK